MAQIESTRSFVIRLGVSTCYTASLESTILKETYCYVQMKRQINNLDQKNRPTDEGRNILKMTSES